MRRFIDTAALSTVEAWAFLHWRQNVIEQCHCLCAVHRDDGMFCRPGDGPVLLTLVGGMLSPQRVPMCGNCGLWWRQRAPQRVARVHAW